MKVLGILFKQSKFLNIMNIVVITIYSCLVLIMLLNIEQSNIEMKAVDQFQGKNLYKISDQLFNEKEEEFFSNENSNKILNNFSDKLLNNKSPDFTYYTAIWQPIEFVNLKADIIFDAYYEMTGKSSEVVVNNQTIRAVKSIQINENVLKLNNIKVAKGMLFESSDFIYDEKRGSLPLILGSEYNGSYTLGDTLDIMYYSKPFKATVIGFLDSSQKILASGEPETLLDRYMILPVMNFNNEQLVTEKNNLFIKASLLARINGFIISEKNPLEIRDLLNKISIETNFHEFEIIGANSVAINTIVDMTELNRNMLIISTVLLFLAVVTTLIITSSIQMKSNVSTYSVLLISGLSIRKISIIRQFQNTLIFAVGFILPLIPLAIIIKQSLLPLLGFYLLIGFLSLILLTFILSIVFKKVMDNLDIIQKLKG